MQFHIFGKLVESKRDRFLVALLYVGGIALIGWGLIELWHAYKTGALDWNPFIILFFLSAGGWVSAIGGAWKDAPLEGFEWFKFFRSPAVAYFWAWVAAHLTDNFAVIALCSIGFTVASIETYKTFFFPSRPRGKFQTMPVLFPDMLQKRKKFIPVFVLCWLFVLTAGALAFWGRHDGLI